LIVGVFVRAGLVWSFGDRPPVIDDALDYDHLAIGLAETGQYMDESGRPTSLRPPLFPFVVSVIYRLAGPGNYFAVSVIQAAISLLTVIVVYRLGSELYDADVGLGAAAMTCFYPTLLAYNQFLLSEVLFTLFVTSGALLTLKVLQQGRLGQALLLGLDLGMGALTRSVLWLFGPVLAAGIAICAHGRWRRRMAVALTIVLAFSAVIAPWAWRNTRVQQTLTFVDVMGGRNVMMGNYEYTPLDRSWATITTQTGARAWHRVLAQETPGYIQLTQGQIDKLAMRRGVHYFFEHPSQSLERSVAKFFNFWQLEREVVAGALQGIFGDLSRSTVLSIALVVCGGYAIAIFAAIIGVICVPPADRRAHALLLGWVLFPCLIHSIAFGHSRYHLPFMPILLVYAAAAVVHRRQLIRRKGHALAAALLCTLLSASWIREFIVVDLQWFV
jgi:4-amino-4-deoxy-L-arabinose transferase-like glycosyltransferase